MKPQAIESFFATLRAANPHPVTELEYTSVFELLAAVLLSAQATDVSVNKATRKLFPIANTPQGLLDLGLERVERAIQTIGLYRTKARNLLQTCRILIEHHGGEVPRTREALEALPGVGRKTANVVLNVAFGGYPHFSREQPHRVGSGKKPAASRKGTRAARAGGLCGRFTPLADPARALCVPGAQTSLLGVRRRTLLRLQGQDAGSGLGHVRAIRRTARCTARAR